MVERLDVKTVGITLFEGDENTPTKEKQQEVLIMRSDEAAPAFETPIAPRVSAKQAEERKETITFNLGDQRGQLPLMKQ